MPIGNPILNTNIENNPTAIASVSPGITVNRLAIHPIDLNASRSSSNPLRIKITLNPAARISLDHRSGKSSTKFPGTFLNTNPNTSIPINDGSLQPTATAPPMCAHAQINVTAHTPPPDTVVAGPFGDNISPHINLNIAHSAHVMITKLMRSSARLRSAMSRVVRACSSSTAEAARTDVVDVEGIGAASVPRARASSSSTSDARFGGARRCVT
mmetsp:Transcript_8720/g.32463  ORF Transcript_8720/g.32463 Transcript_8720/m.32463 type:complete len:213 (-) Transcript_8720:129-767(-)